MNALEAIASLGQALPGAILDKREFRGEWTLVVDRQTLLSVCEQCKNELEFDYLLDITSVDNPDRNPRFDLVYELYSMAHSTHLRLETSVPEEDATMPSVTAIWPGADWHEREVYDMMGLTFTGHPDLRRILMWEGYPYHPLRKDFPLEGKESEVPRVASSEQAPLEGGPFVSPPSDAPRQEREPRAHPKE